MELTLFLIDILKIFTLIQTSCNYSQLLFCPIDYSWSEWNDWSSCSADCGPSVKSRTKFCVPPENGGTPCPQKFLSETSKCLTPECPVNCVPGEWTSWSGCPQNCLKEGMPSPIENRTRLLVTKKAHGGHCNYILREEKTCRSIARCPIHGKFTDWSEWSSCSTSCKGGLKRRTRFCTEPKLGGDPCNGAKSETKKCNENIACVCDTDWKDWGPCSLTCGKGFQIRNGKDCNNNAKQEFKECIVTQCPIEGMYR